MTRLIASVALLALVGACSPSDDRAAETAVAPVLSYTDAFVMEPIGARDMTMGGVTLSVDGGHVLLTGASSASIGSIELHTMAMVDGRMQMRQVAGLELADGETLELKRGGNHFMMFDVGEDVVGGETIDITLNFETSGDPLTLVVEADVRVVGE